MWRSVSDDGSFLYRAPHGKQSHVVLLPGLAAGRWMWEPTIELLTANGYGYLVQSDMFAGAHDRIAPIKGWVRDAMDRYGIGSAVMVGGSFGSRVALDFALEFPDRVESLVLSGAPGSIAAAIAAARHSVKFGGKISRTIVTTAFEWIYFDHRLIPDDIVAATLESFKDPQRVLNLIKLMKACESYDYAAALRRVDAFVLMVWGVNDRISSSELWEHLATGARHGAFTAIDRCGHTPMIEQPDAFNAALLKHLQTAGTATRVADPRAAS
jgi:2-hydroxy-6-oxonona-2,4-dienedioate hydrolase